MKIVTWNIAGGHKLTPNVKDAIGYDKEDLDYFISRLKEVNADIICLQETHLSRDKKYNQTEIIAQGLKRSYCLTQQYEEGESHIKPNHTLAFGTISKYPILSCSHHQPANPNLMIKRHNGKIWRTMDMGILVSEIKILGKIVNLANAHLFPFHYYKKDWSDKEFKHIRKFITDLLIKLSEKPTIAIGDFNYADLKKIYPKIFTKEKYKEAFLAETTPGKGQQDHILFTKHWSLEEAQVIKDVEADHYICLAELNVPN